MKNLFNDISQEERNRILEMHQSATRKNYLSEQTPAPAPAAAPAGVPTGPTVTRRPTVVPDGDNPQGPAQIYNQIDVETFNDQFMRCWNQNTANGQAYMKLKQTDDYYNNKSTNRDAFNKLESRTAVFRLFNKYFLANLTKPMSIQELQKSFASLKGVKVTYNFVELNASTSASDPKNSTVGDELKEIHFDENKIMTDYVNTFNCALKATQGT